MAAILLPPRAARRPLAHLSAFLALHRRLPPVVRFTAPAPFSSSLLPSLTALFPDSLSALRELLPPWVLAVPKSKTSHSKKKMRSAGKGLKEQYGIVACPSCGTAKRAHHLCHACHVDFRQTHHQEAKERAREAREAEPAP